MVAGLTWALSLFLRVSCCKWNYFSVTIFIWLAEFITKYAFCLLSNKYLPCSCLLNCWIYINIIIHTVIIVLKIGTTVATEGRKYWSWFRGCMGEPFTDVYLLKYSIALRIFIAFTDLHFFCSPDDCLWVLWENSYNS